jgi:ribosomal-protein-alanine N-acetyltransferase
MQPSKQTSLERVSLRLAHPGDASLLKRWRSEPSVRRYQPLGPVSVSQLSAELASQRLADLYRGRGEKFQWIIRCLDQPVGWLTLVVTNWDHGLAETGYALSSAHQRRGLMPQALDLLLADLFTNTGLERIEARCAVDNIASQKVLTKVSAAGGSTITSTPSCAKTSSRVRAAPGSHTWPPACVCRHGRKIP